MSTDVSQALVVTQQNMSALVGQTYHSTLNGIQFDVDEQGKLTTTRAELDELIGTIKLIEGAGSWWVGDTACALKDLFGDEAVASFAEKIGKKIELVKKYMSVSRSFGFPNKIAEMRHPDPEVSHVHHQRVQGMNKTDEQLKKRMELLDEASREHLSVAEFDERVSAFKAKRQTSNENEYGVFQGSRFRAFDPKTDNREQFLQDYFNQVSGRDFDEYLNPALREAREDKEARERLADKLPQDVKAQVLADGAALEFDKFKELVETLSKDTEEKKKIETAIDGIKSKKLSDDQLSELKRSLNEKANSENWTFDAFKNVIKTDKDAAVSLANSREKIEKEIEKITDPIKRTEIWQVVTTEKLGLTQVQELVKPVLREQQVQEASDAAAKKAADRIRKQFEEKEANAAKSQTKTAKVANSGDLPLGKKPAAKKKAQKPSPEVVSN